MATGAQLNLFSCSSIFHHQCKTRIFSTFSSSSSLSFPHPPFYCSSISHDASSSRAFRVLAVAEEAPSSPPLVEEKGEEAPLVEEKEEEEVPKFNTPIPKPCQLYVCNLPRSCDVPQLQDMFKPFGAIKSVKVLENSETGISKGSALVTMTSIAGAMAATIALDGSDVGGREMRVKLAEDMDKKKNVQALKKMSKKNDLFETPHRLYVGNLAWAVKSEHLRELFSQYGTVVSAMLHFDRKDGKNRVFAFVSFSSEEALTSAMSAQGTELLGRKIVVRNAIDTRESKKL